MKGRTAAVIVSYQSGEQLLACVESFLADGCESVVVVDNASTDSAIETVVSKHPEVACLALKRNVGYGAAANRGAAATNAEILFVANADVVVHPGALASLQEALDSQPDWAIAGPKILRPDGSVYPSARTFPSLVDSIGHGFLGLFLPSNPWTRRYTLAGWDHSRPAEVDWVSGAFFAVRKLAWDSLGGFDEKYFLYGEDVDLCFRAWQQCWRVGYVPTATATHFQGASAEKRPWLALFHHHRSLWLYACLTMKGPRKLLLPLVAAGLVARGSLVATVRMASVAGRASSGSRV
jgi:N-acetylglucosaminyl-diphospho-decaprenol L-rhamnosyltransferase